MKIVFIIMLIEYIILVFLLKTYPRNDEYI